MFQSNQKYKNLLFTSNFHKLLKSKKKIILRKKPKEFKKIFNTISLVYSLKQKRIWHNNYKRKCYLRTKNQIDLKQRKLIDNSLKFLLRYKRHRKKTSLAQNKWYYYNKNLQKKKTKLHYYQNNLSNFNINKVLHNFFVSSRFFGKTKTLKKQNVKKNHFFKKKKSKNF